MAWVAPITWTTNQVVTASDLNAQIRGNMLETAPAKATGSGGFIVTTGVNTVIQRTPLAANLTDDQSTTSTSYTDLATAGPAVTLTTGTVAQVSVSAKIYGTSGIVGFMGVTVSGASAVPANDNLAVAYQTPSAGAQGVIGRTMIFQGLTGGSNTFTAKYRTTSGTANFAGRRIDVIPF